MYFYDLIQLGNSNVRIIFVVSCEYLFFVLSHHNREEEEFKLFNFGFLSICMQEPGETS